MTDPDNKGATGVIEFDLREMALCISRGLAGLQREPRVSSEELFAGLDPDTAAALLNAARQVLVYVQHQIQSMQRVS